MDRELAAFVLSPVVGGFIGWLTNYLAIRMLFRPQKPLRVPILGLNLQGLIPKRRAELAASIGQVVEQELVTTEDLVDKLRQSGVADDAINAIVAHVAARVGGNLPPFLPQGVRRWLLGNLSEMVRAEAEALVSRMMSWTEERLREEGRLGLLVEEKVARFDLDRLETIILRVSGTELRAIEILGGVLGFLIGLAQAALLLVLR